jgi:hypothetical protein
MVRVSGAKVTLGERHIDLLRSKVDRHVRA